MGPLQFKVTWCCTAVPVPLKLTTVELPVDELLEIVNVPANEPTAVGSNCTGNLIATPGVSVTGNVAPATVYPSPDRLAPLTVTAALPVEVRVSDWTVGVPTDTLPKLRLVALIVRTGLPVVPAPVPFRLIAVAPLMREFVEMEMLPVAAPATVGSNRTWILTAWPGASVTGTEGAASVKPVPVTVRPSIVIEPDPVDVSLIVCVEIEFSDTVPKFRLVGFTVKCRVR